MRNKYITLFFFLVNDNDLISLPLFYQNISTAILFTIHYPLIEADEQC